MTSPPDTNLASPPQYDGQCQCRPGFGGRRCDQCQTNHWGNPRDRCFPCQCDPYGSADTQCDRDTGVCPCKEGMGGDKCDQCARGFKGSHPYCDACGECFDNWDRILTDLRGEITPSTGKIVRFVEFYRSIFIFSVSGPNVLRNL